MRHLETCPACEEEAARAPDDDFLCQIRQIHAADQDSEEAADGLKATAPVRATPTAVAGLRPCARRL
jgi:hypothetical protein